MSDDILIVLWRILTQSTAGCFWYPASGVSLFYGRIGKQQLARSGQLPFAIALGISKGLTLSAEHFLTIIHSKSNAPLGSDANASVKNEETLVPANICAELYRGYTSED